MAWNPKIIDLTRTMNPETIMDLAGKLAAESPALSELKVEYLRNWGTDNGMVCRVTFQDHYGTHLDAPIHIVEGTDDLAKMDLNRLFGEAVCVDMSVGGGHRPISAEELAAAKPEIQEGDIVLIYTGETPGTPDKYVEQAFVTDDAAQWLVDKKVKALGMEPWGVEFIYEGYLIKRYYDLDTPPPHWPTHSILLRNNVYCIEGLTNLDRIKGQRVKFAALPLKIPGISGSPIRAIAWMD